jgi:hypothetical protein
MPVNTIYFSFEAVSKNVESKQKSPKMRRTAIWHFTSTAWKVTNLVAFLCSHILTCEDAQSWTFR